MNKLTTLAVVVAVQAGLVGAAVAPQLSARIAGDTYLFRVAPLDPIDPFRGAYVTVDYPDLQGDAPDFDGGTVFVTLIEQDGVMIGDEYLRERPTGDQPYIACVCDWVLTCGIESFFLPQDEAAEMEQLLRGGAIAEVKIDGRGHAALVAVRAP